MNSLKNVFLSTAVPTRPNAISHVIVDTDACDVQIGWVLLQQQPDGIAKFIGYWSRSFTNAKRKCDTTQPEHLEIVWAVLLLHPYSKSTLFSTCTDYDFLSWILNLMDSTERLTRRLPRLSKFNFNAVHRAGVKHQAVATLSCLLTTGKDVAPLEDDLPLLAIDAEIDHISTLVINANSDYIIPLKAETIKLIETPPTLGELVTKQAIKSNCKKASLSVPLLLQTQDSDECMTR